MCENCACISEDNRSPIFSAIRHLFFLECAPRELNTLADHAAIVAFSMNSDWYSGHQDSIERAKISVANYRLCFDWAKRGQGGAAAGMTLIAYYDDGSKNLLLRAGNLINGVKSWFTAEALALE